MMRRQQENKNTPLSLRTDRYGTSMKIAPNDLYGEIIDFFELVKIKIIFYKNRCCNPKGSSGQATYCPSARSCTVPDSHDVGDTVALTAESRSPSHGRRVRSSAGPSECQSHVLVRAACFKCRVPVASTAAPSGRQEGGELRETMAAPGGVSGGGFGGFEETA